MKISKNGYIYIRSFFERVKDSKEFTKRELTALKANKNLYLIDLDLSIRGLFVYKLSLQRELEPYLKAHNLKLKNILSSTKFVSNLTYPFVTADLIQEMIDTPLVSPYTILSKLIEHSNQLDNFASSLKRVSQKIGDPLGFFLMQEIKSISSSLNENFQKREIARRLIRDLLKTCVEDDLLEIFSARILIDFLEKHNLKHAEIEPITSLIFYILINTECNSVYTYIMLRSMSPIISNFFSNNKIDLDRLDFSLKGVEYLNFYSSLKLLKLIEDNALDLDKLKELSEKDKKRLILNSIYFHPNTFNKLLKKDFFLKTAKSLTLLDIIKGKDLSLLDFQTILDSLFSSRLIESRKDLIDFIQNPEAVLKDLLQRSESYKLLCILTEYLVKSNLMTKKEFQIFTPFVENKKKILSIKRRQI